MNLYRIWQDVNNGYDTYDSAVVAADDEEDARNTVFWYTQQASNGYAAIDKRDQQWCAPEHVHVELIGEAIWGTDAGVILSSFNAGRYERQR